MLLFDFKTIHSFIIIKTLPRLQKNNNMIQFAKYKKTKFKPVLFL